MESQSWCERLYEGNTKPGRRERCHGNRGESKGGGSQHQMLRTNQERNWGCVIARWKAFLEEAWFQGGEEYKRSKGRDQKQGLQRHIHHLHWKQGITLFSYDAQEQCEYQAYNKYLSGLFILHLSINKCQHPCQQRSNLSSTLIAKCTVAQMMTCLGF